MSTREDYRAGVPCWVDTNQPDPAGAARFYSGLFGWQTEDAMPPDAGAHYYMARIDGRDVAAISSQPPGAPPQAVWNTYIRVESADDAAARVREAGGRVLSEPFDVFDAGPATETLGNRMADAAALALVTPTGAFLLRPKPDAFPPDIEDLDSARLDVALRDLPAELTYQHGVDLAVAAVEKGDAQATVLMRPATVVQIAAAAHARRRMPEKSTFFWPKPRTGLVFRPLS